MKNEGNLGKTHRKVIEDVCDCADDKYCILKELILESGPDDRTLDQMKCLEIFMIKLV